MKTVHNQHVRWLAGFMESRRFLKREGVQKDYHSKRLQRMMTYEFRVGIIPFVIFNVVSFLIAGLAIAFGVLSVIPSFKGYDYQTGILFATAGFQLSALYMSFVVPAILSIIRNRKYLKLSPKNEIACILTYMFYFYDFASAFVDLLTHPKKRKEWVRIDHTGEITNGEAQKDGK